MHCLLEDAAREFRRRDACSLHLFCRNAMITGGSRGYFASEMLTLPDFHVTGRCTAAQGSLGT